MHGVADGKIRTTPAVADAGTCAALDAAGAGTCTAPAAVDGETGTAFGSAGDKMGTTSGTAVAETWAAFVAADAGKCTASAASNAERPRGCRNERIEARRGLRSIAVKFWTFVIARCRETLAVTQIPEASQIQCLKPCRIR